MTIKPIEPNKNGEDSPSQVPQSKEASLLPTEDINSRTEDVPSIKARKWEPINGEEKSLIAAITTLQGQQEEAHPLERKDAINATDVYRLRIEEQTIYFKSKKTETDIASLSYSIARIAGLKKAVPPTTNMTMPSVVASQDENHEYLILQNEEGKSVLVNRDLVSLFFSPEPKETILNFTPLDPFDFFKPHTDPFVSPIDSGYYEGSSTDFSKVEDSDSDPDDYDDDYDSVEIGSFPHSEETYQPQAEPLPKEVSFFKRTFSVNNEDGKPTLDIDDDLATGLERDIEKEQGIAASFFETILEDPTLSILTSSDGKKYLCHPSFCEEVEEDSEKLMIDRDGTPFSIENSSEGFYHVVGHDVEGAGQLAVPNLFDGGDLDITRASPAREAFYDRIDFEAFIDCFLATIVLRPEDGKIERLSDANYLFEMLEPENPNSPLAPRMIDLEDSFPADNHYNADFEKTVHPVKTGLMGFPHARKELSNEQRSNVEKKLATLVEKSEEFSNELQGEGLEEDKQEAFFETIRGIEGFLDKKRGTEYTLQDLFFFVFPEYGEQWNLLATNVGGFSNEQVASRVGHGSVEDWVGQFRDDLTEEVLQESAPLTSAIMQNNRT